MASKLCNLELGRKVIKHFRNEHCPRIIVAGPPPEPCTRNVRAGLLYTVIAFGATVLQDLIRISLCRALGVTALSSTIQRHFPRVSYYTVALHCTHVSRNNLCRIRYY